MSLSSNYLAPPVSYRLQQYLQGSASVTYSAPTGNTAVITNAGNYIKLPTSDPTNFDPSTANVFVEAWVYWNGSASWNSPNGGTIYERDNISVQDFGMYTNGSGQLTAYMYTQNGNILRPINNTVLSIQTWYHATFAYNTVNQTAYIWLNGSLGTTASVSNPARYTGSSIFTSIGASPLNGTSNYFWNGYIRDLRVIKGGVIPTTNFTPQAALWSADSVPSYVSGGTNVFGLSPLYTQQIPMRLSISPYVQGSAQILYGSAPTGNTAAYFPGTSGSILNFGTFFPSIVDPLTSNVFVEGWVYFNSLTSPNSTQFVFTVSQDTGVTTTYEDMGMFMYQPNGQIAFRVWDTAGNQYQGACNSLITSAGVWYHVAGSWDRTNNKVYAFINGTVGAFVATAAGTIRNRSTSVLTFAAGNGSTGSYLPGNMYTRDFRIVKGGIVPTTSFTPQTAPWALGSIPSYVTGGTNVFGLAAQYMQQIGWTGTPLFSQISASAAASAVGAYSLRAVKGTTAKAVQVTQYTLLTVPPIGLTQNTFTATGTYNGVTNGQYVALCSNYSATSDAYRCFDQNIGTRGLTGGTQYTVGTGVFIGSASTVDSTSTTYNGGWFQIQIPSAINAVSYSLGVHSSLTLTAPYTWKLFGSTTGASGSWVVLDTQTNYVFASQTVNFPLATMSSGYTYFRLAANMISPSSTSGDLGPAAIVIYGYSSLVSSAQDFYADRLGNLLTAPVTGQTLASWLGGATGYVTTWYDQSGQGKDMTQTTASVQPTINLATSPPSILFTGNGTTSGQYLLNSSFFNFGTNYQYTIRAVVNNTTGGCLLYKGAVNFPWNLGGYKKWWLGALNGAGGESSTGGYPNLVGNSEGYIYGQSAITSTKSSFTWSSTSFSSVALYENASSVSVSYNRVGGGISDPASYLYIGAGGSSSYYNGNIYEIEIFSSTLGSSDVTIMG